jgi:hypothetical protein
LFFIERVFVVRGPPQIRQTIVFPIPINVIHDRTRRIFEQERVRDESVETNFDSRIDVMRFVINIQANIQIPLRICVWFQNKT